jgi:DNA-binding transcriptional regulator YdaS (Cro superfamily)
MKSQGLKATIDDGLRQAIEKMGCASALARALGLSPQAFSEWRRVPSHQILQVEAVTGIGREKLRPDLYDEASLDRIEERQQFDDWERWLDEGTAAFRSLAQIETERDGKPSAPQAKEKAHGYGHETIREQGALHQTR